MKRIESMNALRNSVRDAVNMEMISDQLTQVRGQLSGLKKKLENSVSEDEAFFMMTIMFLAGVILGMIISPKGRGKAKCKKGKCCKDKCCEEDIIIEYDDDDAEEYCND